MANFDPKMSKFDPKMSNFASKISQNRGISDSENSQVPEKAQKDY